MTMMAMMMVMMVMMTMTMAAVLRQLPLYAAILHRSHALPYRVSSQRTSRCHTHIRLSQHVSVWDVFAS